MNQEHYDKVKRVLSKSEATLTAFKQKMDVKEALVACAGACNDIWEQEFPVAQGYGDRVHLDLSGSDLQGGLFASLGGTGCLNGADFRRAQLDGSRWVFIHVKGATFAKASLRGCNAIGLCCGGSVFHETDLSGSDMDLIVDDKPLDLLGANLTAARIRPLPPSLTEEQRKQVAMYREKPSSSGSCFIATAACGDMNAWEVLTLREFRDRVLTASAIGRLFVQVYYALSPPLAGIISRSPLLRAVAKAALIRPLARSTQRLMQRTRTSSRG